MKSNMINAIENNDDGRFDEGKKNIDWRKCAVPQEVVVGQLYRNFLNFPAEFGFLPNCANFYDWAFVSLCIQYSLLPVQLTQMTQKL